jgi:hypothetical protein
MRSVERTEKFLFLAELVEKSRERRLTVNFVIGKNQIYNVKLDSKASNALIK